MSSILYRRVANVIPSIIKSYSRASAVLAKESETLNKAKSGQLKLSDSCVKKLKQICDDKSFLRIIVEGGGCSGFQYKFDIDTKMQEDDLTFGSNSAKVVIDKVSMEFVDGATVDYHTELIKSGFRIIGNPKAEQGCSCGASFSLKLK